MVNNKNRDTNTFWSKYLSTIVGTGILILFIAVLLLVNNYFKKRDTEEFRRYGVNTTARVYAIYTNKRGYDIDYEYSVKGEKIRVGDLASEIPEGLHVGDCYPLIYSSREPLVRQIDFSKRIEYQAAPSVDEDRAKLQKQCGCTSVNIRGIKKNSSGGVDFNYHIQSDKGGYTRYIHLDRYADINAILQDSIFLVLYYSDDHSIQRIFLNTPRAGASLDTFPTENNCKNAINDLSKKPNETPYIY